MRTYNLAVLMCEVLPNRETLPTTATLAQALELSRAQRMVLLLSDDVGFDRFTTYPDFTWKVH